MLKSIKDVMEAIESVRAQAKIAIDNGEKLKAQELVGNSIALQSCLITEVEKFLTTDAVMFENVKEMKEPKTIKVDFISKKRIA